MIVLASASPRRHELLQSAGIEHVVQPVDVDEVRMPGESASELVRRLAYEKAHSVPLKEPQIVLGADTVVSLGGDILGKPEGQVEAQSMLRRLSGQTHLVYSGICLRSSQRTIVDAAETSVTFASLSEQEIADYLDSNEWAGKAGAYAIQGLASKFVTALHGSYHNVVGLPVSMVYRYLKQL